MLRDFAAFYSQHLVLFTVSMAVLGLVVGSFLNVVIYRLPIILNREWRAQAAEMLPIEASGLDGSALDPSGVDPTDVLASHMTLSTPRSACPSCRAPIAAWQNIPVLSWLLLRGRCAACKAPISIRYPLVEIATGVLSAAVAWHFGFNPATVCALMITWMLIALIGIDIDHQLLPDDITLPLLWLGLIASVVFSRVPGIAIPVAPRDAVIGAAAGYSSLWLVFQAFRIITGKEGMGYGDFKLFGALGAWLGWKLLPLIILLSAATGAVVGLSMIALRGRDRAAPMPFGPYLAAAGWLAMMYGHSLVDGYLRLSGLER